jgi:boron transporter
MYLFRDIIKDLKNRLPLYLSDWRDGFHVKILSATLFMFFSSLLPAATFGAFLNEKTEGVIGVVEVRMHIRIVSATRQNPILSKCI